MSLKPETLDEMLFVRSESVFSPGGCACSDTDEYWGEFEQATANFAMFGRDLSITRLLSIYLSTVTSNLLGSTILNYN